VTDFINYMTVCWGKFFMCTNRWMEWFKAGPMQGCEHI